MRLSTRALVSALAAVSFLAAPAALAQSDGDDLVETSVSAYVVTSDARVQHRLAELADDEAYEGHTFLRLKKDLAQTKKLRFYVDPETFQPVEKKGNPKAVKLVAERTSVITQGEAGYAWTGELRVQNRKGEFAGEVFLYVTDRGEVSGTIHVKGEVYLVESVGGGVSMVVAVDEGERYEADDAGGVGSEDLGTVHGIPDLAPAARSMASSPDAVAQTSASASSTTYIQRVLVLYTSEVQSLDDRSSYDFVQRINQEAARTNSAYAASDIDEFDIQLAGVRVYPSFNEAGNTEDDLLRLQQDDGVRALRDQYQADLVMLVTSSASDALGRAFLNTTTQDRGYSVITWESLFGVRSSGYVFAHELGHNQGATHHPLDPRNGTPAYDYSYGHRFEDRDYFIFNIRDSYYATVMAYTPCATDDCGAQFVRVPRFSNPYVEYDDQPTGIVNARDNALTLRNTAFRISNLYVNRFSARVSVFGPDAPYPGPYTFTASTSGTESASTYAWYLSQNPSYYGSVRSTSRTYTQSLSGGTWFAKLVTTSTAGTTRTVYRTVDVVDDGGPIFPCEDDGVFLCPVEGFAELDAPTLVVGEPLAVSPNPMGPSGHVTVGLEAEANVTLAVYDALGREVRRLASGTLGAGAHPFALDAAALPPGVYVARLTVDGAVSAQPFTVTR